MDVHVALEEIARWCAQQTAAGDPDAIEVDCHAMVVVTIGEAAPPWHARRERRCSAGASSPVAQLRCDMESGEWVLHHGETARGWCSYEDGVRAREIGALLDEIARDRAGRFRGLPADLEWPR
jgi:DUF3024 family protein